MPSQKQVRWAQLRVGLTVIFAALVLGVLIFLMTGDVGLLSRKLKVKAYFENAGGLRVGAPVRLEGVDIGNVTQMRVTTEKPLTPVQVTLKLGTKYAAALKKDSTARLSTAGVLGETFVDISSKAAKGPPLEEGDTLLSEDVPDLQDVVRASETTLRNVEVLVKRLDRIVATVESGQGSVGKLINDPTVFNRLDATLREVHALVGDVSKGKGTVGKLLKDEELYDKLNASLDKVNKMVAAVDRGEGTVGKLLKDESLYREANETIARANRIMADVEAGRGALGKFAKDEAFAAKLDATMTNINTLVARMEAGEGSVGKLLKDPSLYTNADQMLLETRKLVQAIRENPKRYLTIHFRIF